MKTGQRTNALERINCSSFTVVPRTNLAPSVLCEERSIKTCTSSIRELTAYLFSSPEERFLSCVLELDLAY